MSSNVCNFQGNVGVNNTTTSTTSTTGALTVLGGTGISGNLNVGGNMVGQTFISGLTSTVSSGSTLTLTSSSNTNQIITGTLTHTIIFPNATTLFNGQQFLINNQSASSVSIQNASSVIIAVLQPNYSILCILSSNSTSAGVWSSVGGTQLVQSNSRIGALGYQYNSSSAGTLGVINDLGVINKKIKPSHGIANNNVNNWTTRTTSFSSNWYGICWSPELGLFVNVSSNSTNCQTSPDGTIWTTQTGGSTGVWTSVCWASELGLFVAVSNYATANTAWVMTSGDGISWTQRTVPSANNFSAVCWSAELGIFVAVSSAGSVATSSNGTTWN